MAHFYGTSTPKAMILSRLRQMNIVINREEDLYDNTALQEQITKLLPQYNADILTYQSETFSERNTVDIQCFRDYLAGALGEESVNSALMQLDDRFHILRGWRVQLPRTAFSKVLNQYIRQAEVDHVVLGPIGWFVIESKNWSMEMMRNHTLEIFKQLDRIMFIIHLRFSTILPRPTPMLVTIQAPLPIPKFLPDNWENVKKVFLPDLVETLQRGREIFTQTQIKQYLAVLQGTAYKNNKPDYNLYL